MLILSRVFPIGYNWRATHLLHFLVQDLDEEVSALATGQTSAQGTAGSDEEGSLGPSSVSGSVCSLLLSSLDLVYSFIDVDGNIWEYDRSDNTYKMTEKASDTRT